jgi:hypothetical protein
LGEADVAYSIKSISLEHILSKAIAALGIVFQMQKPCGTENEYHQDIL